MDSFRSSARLFSKLRGRSATELRERGAQRLAMWLERASLLDAREPGDADFFKSLSPAVTDRSIDGWLAHFRERTAPVFFAGFEDKAATIASLRETVPGFEAHVLERANEILAGRFDLLGHERLHCGAEPDWHLDPTSGVRAPMVHWSTIAYLDPDVAGDHKVVWELNRHQWLVTLGMAYWFTRDERYPSAFAAAVRSWMDDNPPKVGVNWASSLEVSFRAIAWLWALQLFRSSPALTPELFARMTKYLALFARHLERNLSTWFSPNTHLTGEALGLFYLGLSLPELRGARDWRSLGSGVLLDMLPIHARPDGVYFEQSVYYQRYTVDFYLHFLLLAERNGLDVRDEVAPRLDAMLTHLAYLSRPDGTVPLIGDDDGGQLLPIDGRMGQDVQPVLSTGAFVLERPEWAFVSGGPTAELVWLCGADAPRAMGSTAARAPEGTSRGFPDGGVYVMRDGWDESCRHLVIDCGPHGSMNCGHAHADALAIEVSVGTHPLIVDPGTFVYTSEPDLRDGFRSTAAHNTMTVDGESSSLMAGPFHWERIATSEPLLWRTGVVADWFEGRHDGYANLPEPTIHRRGVLFIRGSYWVLRDVLDSSGGHSASLAFQAASGTSITRSDAQGADIGLGREAGIRIGCYGAHGKFEVESGWVSRRYGAREPAPRGRYSFVTSGPETVISFLLPMKANASGPFPAVEPLAAAKGHAFSVDDGVNRDLLLFDSAQAEVAGVETDAAVAWIRRDARTGLAERAVAIGGTHLMVDGESVLTVSAAGCEEAVRDSDGWRPAAESPRSSGALRTS